MSSPSKTDVAIVVVTFNRKALLERLLNSIDRMDSLPRLVIVINNASTDGTQEVLERWGKSKRNFQVECIELDSNTGGAGGFKAGIQKASESGASWIWVMDDDVEIFPDALISAEKWTDKFDAFMGQRLTPNGEIVNWSHLLSNMTGLAPLFPRKPFGKSDSVESNSGCFEGMFISAIAVESVGFPDSRFFITWDDAVYGWLISRKHKVGYVKDIFLQRTVEMKSVGTKSITVYARNDLGRYYFIRNRALQAKYFQLQGSLNKFWFALGTFRVVVIEVIRALLVERKISGIKVILKAVKDLKALRNDKTFLVPESTS